MSKSKNLGNNPVNNGKKSSEGSKNDPTRAEAESFDTHASAHKLKLKMALQNKVAQSLSLDKPALRPDKALRLLQEKKNTLQHTAQKKMRLTPAEALSLKFAGIPLVTKEQKDELVKRQKRKAQMELELAKKLQAEMQLELANKLKNKEQPKNKKKIKPGWI